MRGKGLRPEQEAIRPGVIWRRKKSGALVRIVSAIDTASDWNTTAYFDIKWETVEKPVRRGYTFEEYWLRNCEPTATPPTTQARTPAGSTEEATS